MDQDKIVLMDHVLLRCVTDLRSFRHICDLLIKIYPNLKAVTLEKDLIPKLNAELLKDIDGLRTLTGQWLIVYTREPNQTISDDKVTEDWKQWRYGHPWEGPKCT